MKENDYIENFRGMIELERRKEMETHRAEMKNLSGKEREEKGRALLNLKGQDAGKGLGGKFMVKFKKQKRNTPLPDNEINVGDLIMVSKRFPLNKDNPSGSVAEVTNFTLSVAFDNPPPDFCYGKNLRIDLYVNDITFQRMLDTLDSYRRVKGRKKNLFDVLLGRKEPDFRTKTDVEILNGELNTSQKKAVEKSLKAKDFFLVHGPPGTGKTTTLIEIARQLIRKGERVLATADSNVAVDNLLEGLIDRGEEVIRVGHPARVTEALRQHTLDYRVEENEDYIKAQDLRDEAFELKDSLSDKAYSGEWRRGLSNERILQLAKQGRGARGLSPERIKKGAERVKKFRKIDELFDRAKQLENQAVDKILRNHAVICATCSTAGSQLLDDKHFETAVIDEATQATEPSCLIPISKAKRFIMAGDHKQLPPTILSEKAAREGLETSMFERLNNLFGDSVTSMLDVQYRMNDIIMNFSSEQCYSGKLKADSSVKSHRLFQLPEADKNCHTERVLIFMDTKKLEARERQKADSTSLENPKEVKTVEKYVRHLLDSGVKPGNMAVISPYQDQVKRLNNSLSQIDNLETKTVDGFQGREKEVVVVSLVRSNPNRNIGFLKDIRRMNVTLTRARRQLAVVGDSSTIGVHDFYTKFLKYVKNHGSFRELEAAPDFDGKPGKS